MKTALMATAALVLLTLGAHANVVTEEYDVVGPAQSSCTDGMVFEYQLKWIFHIDDNYFRTTWIFHGIDVATGDYILNGIGRDMFMFDPLDPFDAVHTIEFDQQVTGRGSLPDFHLHFTQQVHRDGTIDPPHYFITCEP
jgi:hypothetical protein